MTRREFITYSSLLLGSNSVADSFSLNDLQVTNYSTQVAQIVSWFKKQRLPKIIVNDSKLQIAIYKLSLPFFEVSNRDVNWEIYIVNENNINAYTLGGGLICVDINLIKECKNETELVSVIAHEVGHVHYKHAERRLTKNDIFKQLNINSLGKLNVKILGKSYKRIWEHEADAFILKAFIKMDYNIKKASSFFKKLEKLHPDSSNVNDCIFSTHPQHKNRISKLEAIASTYTQLEYKSEESKEFKYLKNWSKS